MHVRLPRLSTTTKERLLGGSVLVLAALACGTPRSPAKDAVAGADVPEDAGDVSATHDAAVAADETTGLPPVKVMALANGYSHVCALRDDGRVACWGDNNDGQLGNGSRVPSAIPILVPGLTDVTAVGADSRQTCAVRKDQSAWCWGRLEGFSAPDEKSQLTPKEVPGAGQVTAIQPGDHTTCAIRTDGSVVCWGQDCACHQMGDDGCVGHVCDGEIAPTPVELLPPDAVQVAVVSARSCALDASGVVACWIDSLVAEPVAGLTGVVAFHLAPSGGMVALLKSGKVVVLGGHPAAGQAAGCPDSRCDAPTAIPGIDSAIGLDTDGGRCALLAGGTLRCWDQVPGQVEDGAFKSLKAPFDVAGLPAVAEVASGAATCVRTADGRVWCWGGNGSGQVGNGTMGASLVPQGVPDLKDVHEIRASAYSTCARSGTQTRCWGSNYFEELGTSQALVPVPRLIPHLANAVSLSAGYANHCALRADSTVACLGPKVQPGLGPAWQKAPQTLGGLGEIAKVVLSSGGLPQSGCLQRVGGQVACWARFSKEMAGVALPDDVSLVWPPVEVTPAFGAIDLEMADNHACAVLPSGKVACWGDPGAGSALGFLGLGAAPLLVPGMTDAVRVATPAQAICVVRAGGEVACIGWDGNGVLGNGPGEVDQKDWVQVAGLPPVVDIAQGYLSVCVLGQDGSVWCWGDNESGQLGDGSLITRHSPVQAVGLTDAVQVELGRAHACARRQTGEVACWGAGFAGQTGNGHAVVLEPVEVPVP